MADDTAGDLTVYVDWTCSKCRATRDLLDSKPGEICDGNPITVHYVEYVETRPGRDELEALLGMLGADDPRAMMRTGDALYAELGLAHAGRDELLDALVAQPILLERPIARRGGRAVVARPPERVLELLA